MEVDPPQSNSVQQRNPLKELWPDGRNAQDGLLKDGRKILISNAGDLPWPEIPILQNSPREDHLLVGVAGRAVELLGVLTQGKAFVAGKGEGDEGRGV